MSPLVPRTYLGDSKSDNDDGGDIFLTDEGSYTCFSLTDNDTINAPDTYLHVLVNILAQIQ